LTARPSSDSSHEQEDAPVVLRRVAEPFQPRETKYNEMSVLEGELVYAFESLAQNGWVYGYKQDEANNVISQGWLPAAILVAFTDSQNVEDKSRSLAESGQGASRRNADEVVADVVSERREGWRQNPSGRDWRGTDSDGGKRGNAKAAGRGRGRKG
jgi:hypothetical protein